MNCCILYRVNGGKVEYVGKTDDWNQEWIHEFANMDEAVDYADKNQLLQMRQVDYQIVELDEL